MYLSRAYHGYIFLNFCSKHAFFDDFWLKNAKETFFEKNFYRIILSDLREKFRAIKKPYSSNELAWAHCFLNFLLKNAFFDNF